MRREGLGDMTNVEWCVWSSELVRTETSSTVGVKCDARDAFRVGRSNPFAIVYRLLAAVYWLFANVSGVNRDEGRVQRRLFQELAKVEGQARE